MAEDTSGHLVSPEIARLISDRCTVVVRLCFHAIIFCFDLKIELLRFKYSMQGKYLLVNGLHHASEGSESQQKGIILESFLKTILICVSLFHIATEKCQ